MAAFQKRQADRAKSRIERDADIRQSLKAGATLADLGRKYQITMERVRQIGMQCGTVGGVVIGDRSLG
jgi:DNA-directed RNA polymerase sigma subunit (sigma70/sigma32)